MTDELHYVGRERIELLYGEDGESTVVEVRLHCACGWSVLNPSPAAAEHLMRQHLEET